MNILFLGYWDIDEPLTKATIFPNLKILQDLEGVSRIVFVNTERGSLNPQFSPDFSTKKIIYHPLFSKNFKVSFFNKISDFIYFPRELKKLFDQYEIDLVIARGAPAGSLAYLSWRKTGVPFLVESFEPHADYMLECGIWHKFDLRYICQKRWENRQKRYAKGLLPVTEAYRQYLVNEGLPSERVITVPCSVNFNEFCFADSRREAMRKKYQLPGETTVGIYVGKFGGLYLEKESFELFQGAFRHYKEFFLIILTPLLFHAWINQQIKKHCLPAERIMIRSVKNNAVPDYLMMSDFAYATYKPGFFKAFLSPVKIAEYWGCGLPVVMTLGVGDESAIIEANSAGVLFDPNDINGEWIMSLYGKLDCILRKPGLREKISSLAKILRSPEKSKDAYNHFLFD